MYFDSQEYIDAVFEQGFKLSMRINPMAKEVTHYNYAEQCAIKAEKKQDRFYGRDKKYQFVKNADGEMELVNMRTETI